MAQQPMTRRERRDAERAAAAAAAQAQSAALPSSAAAPAAPASSSSPTTVSAAAGDLPTAATPAAAAPAAATGTDAPAQRRRRRSTPPPTPPVRPATEALPPAVPEPAAAAEPEPAAAAPEPAEEPVPEADPVAPPRPRSTQSSRRRGISAVGRVGILTLLAVATVLAPLSSQVTADASGTAALSAPQDGQSPSSRASSGNSTSVAAAVLGSDADVDTSTDTELSNVPDAATLARIRAAYENAAVTCAAPASGASGDTSAFTTAPEVFFPMVAGTYEISSPYGYRLHPTLGTMKLHAGQDYSAPVGTPMYAVAAGKVVTAGMVDGTGTVTIEHNVDGQTWYTSYLHMYEDGIYVKVGDEVTAGQLIAGVGNTGRSTGAHLHFEVRTKNDMADTSTVDPQAWLAEHQAVELSTDCS
ncbi:M23 family metallopeptidase [Actinomyces howellii]|uniref:Glycyl-glycine endopeptidase ALE-1 n=1 Tax=Actinomyces howellii TaxID=52771 RepID=A0A448HK32_9ACTO|nr:M23 family metallopeptidase [Actinomyces howellii]VEG29978.1 Glycyl-glycine endopeptidase ALE-1 precursor [Actinomyces howellii]